MFSSEWEAWKILGVDISHLWLSDISRLWRDIISLNHPNKRPEVKKKSRHTGYSWRFGPGRSKFLHLKLSYNHVLSLKHCQRHNGPEGWVLITSSNTNLDQISSSESRPSIIFKISTKHQPLHKTWASKSWPNLASESRPRFNFITSTKHQRQNTEQTPASKSCLNFNFKILTNLVLKVWTKVYQHDPRHQREQQ